MLNYSKGQPLGNNLVPQFQSPAPVKALARIVSENGTASSVIGLSHDTTAVEVGTGGTAAVIKWVSTADGTGPQTSVIAIAGSTANFDHLIPANTVRRFVVPIESFQSSGEGSAMGANRANGLYQRIAYKTQGVGSVLLSEY